MKPPTSLFFLVTQLNVGRSDLLDQISNFSLFYFSFISSFILYSITIYHLYRDNICYFYTDRDVLSVFISKVKGEELLGLTSNGSRVMVHLTIGPPSVFRYANINRTSVLFVSVSFIILMIISLAWLIFYYIQRFRYIQAKDVLAVRSSYLSLGSFQVFQEKRDRYWETSFNNKSCFHVSNRSSTKTDMLVCLSTDLCQLFSPEFCFPKITETFVYSS